MKLASALRWCLFPIAAMGGCSGALALTGIIGTGIDRALAPVGLDAYAPLDVRAGLTYGAAAVVFILAGSLVAPKYRSSVAASLYALGACVAWFVLRHWSFPEYHRRAYQESLVPLSVTLVGGLLGLLLVVAGVKHHRTRSIRITKVLEQIGEREAAG